MTKEALLIDKLEEIVGEKTVAEVDEIFSNAKTFMTYYRCAMLEIETKFNVLNEQFSLRHERNPIEYIKTRLKSFESITNKLQRKNLLISLETVAKELNDVAGVRVVCSFIDDIYLLADCLINQDDVRLIKMKDYIKNPKKNGYRSLHLIVEIPIFLQKEKKYIKVEVQLRTIAMELWANLEHRMRYKKNLNAEILEIINQELYECASISHLLDTRMKKIRKIVEGE